MIYSMFLPRQFALVCILGQFTCAKPSGPETYSNLVPNFQKFSSNFLAQSEFDRFKNDRGAVILAPLGVGYMLANIYAKVWNIPTVGIEEALQTSKSVAGEYSDLLTKMNTSGIDTWSGLFMKKGAESGAKLTDEAKKLKLEVFYSDFEKNWQETWTLMNNKIVENTGGKMDNVLVPKGGLLGPAFYPFVTSVFINTNHYKNKWNMKWTSIGEKKFSDGAVIPFLRAEGLIPVLEHDLFTAVSFELQDQDKCLVFAMPKGNFEEIRDGQFIESLISSGCASRWETDKKSRKIEVPALNMKLFQAFNEFKKLGTPKTSCPDEAFNKSSTKSNETLQSSYFSGPIVQAGHIQLTPEFFEVASATGSSVNSEAELREFLEDSDSGLTRPGRDSSGDVSSKKSQKAVALTRGADKDTIRFDKPFFWYLRDKNVGPTYFGAVQSLDKYKKEYEPEEEWDFVLDTIKTHFWNCRQLQG